MCYNKDVQNGKCRTLGCSLRLASIVGNANKQSWSLDKGVATE